MDERSKIEFVVGNKRVFGQEIRKKGKVNFNRFHKELVPWFHDNKYTFIEKNLTGKDLPSGRDEKIEWVGERKVDSYFKFVIYVEYLLFRIRGNEAEMTARFKGYLEKDYNGLFEKRYRKFGEFLRKLYERYIIKDKINKLMGKVWGETNDFIDENKKIMDLIIK